jgi:hypothetical protein
MATKKEPQRWQRTCIKCQKKFSTHSTDRQDCYSCRPKCREIHYFHRQKKNQEQTKIS